MKWERILLGLHGFGYDLEISQAFEDLEFDTESAFFRHLVNVGTFKYYQQHRHVVRSR